MLDAAIISQLQGYVTKITTPVELVASLDDSPKAHDTRDLLVEVASLSDLISFREDGHGRRRPSFSINRAGTEVGVEFAGVPMGHEFTSFVLALLQVGGHPVAASDEVVEAIRAIDADLNFETYFSLSCQNCPDVVQALNAMSVLNPRIRHIAIDGAVFADEVEARGIMAVPTVFCNGELFDQGRMTLEQIVAKIDTGAAERAAAALRDKDPFDVLVVGAGPAGAAAAIYAARKGIRTGVVAERFGGQVLDTMAIENFVSVTHTEGPALASALEAHVRTYDVDVMTPFRAASLRPADDGDGLHEVMLGQGEVLRAKTVIITSGARWRQMGVPGEDEYRNRGVTFCPHCDGPLFKAKPVAVIGGGNSGVEAAIDLAGVASHVTLVEFLDELGADSVLQRKLRSLTNVKVVTSARTTEVLGDGTRVVGLAYVDTATGEPGRLTVAGVFVQIGLLPNSEWLGDTLKLTERGEVVIDDHGRTSAEGVFAAGDVTTEPFKQIVIAMGGGATAALSAFDHLIRSSAPAAPAMMSSVD